MLKSEKAKPIKKPPKRFAVKVPKLILVATGLRYFSNVNLRMLPEEAPTQIATIVLKISID